MPLPVYDLSGVDHVVSRQTDAGSASCSANVSVVQAMKTNRDCFVYEVYKGRKSTFVFAAAITSLRVLGAAHHLQANWFNTLTKLYKPRSHRAACPLYSALLKVSSAFTKASPYNDSIVAHTSVSACLMDLTTNEVFSLHYGSGAAAPWFDTEGHSAPTPRTSRVHFVNGVQVHCSSQQLSGGHHTIIVGSSGLWSQIHPQKASMHARLFASTRGTIDARNAPHDPATAVLRAALRGLVERFSPSKDARKASLYHIKQLDRLPPGSRQEEAGKGLIPRGRGDIHPDLTAIVLSVDSLAAAPSTPATPDSCRVKAWFRTPSVASKLGRHDDAASASDCSTSLAGSLNEDSLDIFSIPANPCATAEELFQELVSSRVLMFSAESSSRSCAGASTPSTPRRGLIPRGPSLQSLTSRATSAADMSVSPRAEAQRRWRLLKLYVRGVLPAETALKATLWEGLLERAGRPVGDILCSRACLDVGEALRGSESTLSGLTRASASSYSGATQQGFGPSPVSEGFGWNAVNPRMVY